MGEWRRRSLFDAIDLQRGFDLPETRRRNGGVPVVASTSIVGWHDEARVPGPGVVIGRSGSIGGGRWVEDDFWPLNTTLWVKNFRQNDRRFVYYMLRSIDFSRFNAGSGVPTLNRNHLTSVDVLLPPLAEQRAIAGVLGALDDKIESNRRLIATIDEVTQLMWWQTFYEGAEPTWHSGKLSDLCESQYGYTASAAEAPVGPHLVRVMDINKQNWVDWSEVPFCECDGTDRQKYQLQLGDILVARMADPGKSAIIESAGVAAVFASYLVRLKTQSLADAYFVYGFLKSKLFLDYAAGAASGSVQKNMNARVICEANVVIPTQGTRAEYLREIVPLREALNQRVTENGRVRGLRDALLPELLSGRLRVREAEEMVEDVV